MLKKHFHLYYKRFKTANYKYKDPSFNEKRVWVCRILTQFLSDKAMVICLDETGFRSDTVKDMKWQFNSYMKKERVDLGFGCKSKVVPLNVLTDQEYRDAKEYIDGENRKP